jgi:hypothetical protein
MDANGTKVLVDLLTLAHLHTSRATWSIECVPLNECWYNSFDYPEVLNVFHLTSVDTIILTILKYWMCST